MKAQVYLRPVKPLSDEQTLRFNQHCEQIGALPVPAGVDVLVPEYDREVRGDARITMSEDGFTRMVEGEAGEHGEMLEDGGPFSGWCFSCEELLEFSRGIINAWGMERRAQEAALAASQPGAQPCVCSSDEGATCTTHYGPGCLYGRADVEPRAAAVVDGFVIANGSGEKYMAWGQMGPEWVSDRSSALWLVRRADAEALAAENEDAWLILPVERCALPPNGWACTLASGHEGPCPTIAAPPAQGIDLGQFIALAKFGEEFAFSAEKQPHSRVVYSQASRLLALIDQRDAAPGVGQ